MSDFVSYKEDFEEDAIFPGSQWRLIRREKVRETL